MKQLKLVIAVLALVLLSACESSTNYSKLLEQEQKNMDLFMARNGYTVITEFPADSVFKPGEFYREDDESIYFRIDQKGTGAILVSGDELLIRYVESTLDEYPTVISRWDSSDQSYPPIRYYDSLTNSCQGWNDAFDMIQRSGTIVQIVVPSKLGFDDASDDVIPYHYKLKMLIVPK